jgi:hypothetical protein
LIDFIQFNHKQNFNFAQSLIYIYMMIVSHHYVNNKS